MVRRLSSVDHSNQLCEGCLLKNMLKTCSKRNKYKNKKKLTELIYIYIYIYYMRIITS